MKEQRARFWIEAGAATVTGLMALVTLAWPDWIEEIFGVDPDRHSGALEWGIVAGLVVVTTVLIVAARGEWRLRARTT